MKSTLAICSILSIVIIGFAYRAYNTRNLQQVATNEINPPSKGASMLAPVDDVSSQAETNIVADKGRDIGEPAFFVREESIEELVARTRDLSTKEILTKVDSGALTNTQAANILISRNQELLDGLEEKKVALDFQRIAKQFIRQRFDEFAKRSAELEIDSAEYKFIEAEVHHLMKLSVAVDDALTSNEIMKLLEQFNVELDQRSKDLQKQQAK